MGLPAASDVSTATTWWDQARWHARQQLSGVRKCLVVKVRAHFRCNHTILFIWLGNVLVFSGFVTSAHYICIFLKGLVAYPHIRYYSIAYFLQNFSVYLYYVITSHSSFFAAIQCPTPEVPSFGLKSKIIHLWCFHSSCISDYYHCR